MVCPFPGMDPYLEAPGIWPDFHDAFAAEIRGELNRTLPVPYYARLEQSVEVTVESEPIQHHFVEIRDPSRGHQLVTLMEFASPSNKRAGPDRDAYEAKQYQLLSSDTSLVEVDLLRSGTRLIRDPSVDHVLSSSEPPADYLVGIRRGWQQGPARPLQLFPISVREPLPCIPVPLRADETEVPLDLQYIFSRTWQTGPLCTRRGGLLSPARSATSP